MVSIKRRKNGKTCVRSKLRFFEDKVSFTKDGLKKDPNGRTFNFDSSYYCMFKDELPEGNFETEITGDSMELLGFSWKEIQEENYSHMDDDGSMKSKFKASVYNDGYRPKDPSTWDKLAKWVRGTPSMTQKDKAEALGESEYIIRKKCGM